ncbi:MAG: ABC transporter permease [Bacillota bacterium]
MKLWVASKAIFYRNLVLMRSYFFNTISMLVTMYIVFLLMFYGAKAVGGASLSMGDTLEGLIVGYLVWMFAIMAYSDLSWSLTNEAQVGTLEQLYLSPAGFKWLSGMNLASNFLLNAVIAFVLLLGIMLTTGHWLRLDLISLLPLLVVTVLSAYGIGFAMGGLALIFKRIQSFFQILQFVFVAFIVLPWDRFPWAKYLPLAMGNVLTRRVMVEGTRLWQLPFSDLLVLAGTSLFYLAAGLVAFSTCERAAKDRGLLGHY